MGRKKPRVDLEEVKANMTPMIDVTFLLLIFFVLTLKFKVKEGLIQSYLPKNQGQSGGTPKIDLNEMRIKLLWYKPDGTPIDPTTRRDADPFMEGYVVLKVGQTPLTSPSPPGGLDSSDPMWIHDPCWQKLNEMIIEAKGRYKGGGQKGLPVKIDARRQVPFQFVVRALDEVCKVGIEDVTFAPPEKPYTE